MIFQQQYSHYVFRNIELQKIRLRNDSSHIIFGLWLDNEHAYKVLSLLRHPSHNIRVFDTTSKDNMYGLFRAVQGPVRAMCSHRAPKIQRPSIRAIYVYE